VNHTYRYVIIEGIVDNVRRIDWLYKTTRFLNWSRNSKNVGSHLIGTYNGCRSCNKRACVIVRYFIYGAAIHEGQGRGGEGWKVGRRTANGVLILCAYIKCDIIHGADKSKV